MKLRNGVLVGDKLMSSYDWKAGQSVSLGTLNNVAFVIAGVFRAEGSALETRAIAGRRFVQEALKKQGIANTIIVQVDDTKNAEEVIRFIDEDLKFPIKTHTKREKEFLASITTEMEDILSFSRWIILSTIFVILLGVANTVSMSMRDRVQEIGVLRTLGFSRARILMLVLYESSLVALAGGLAAAPVLLAAFGLFETFVGRFTIEGVGITFGIEPWMIAIGLPAAALAGAAGGAVPAFLSTRWAIVDCFRAVD